MKKELKSHIDYESKKEFKKSFIDVFPVYDADFPLEEYSPYDASFKCKRKGSDKETGCLVEIKRRKIQSNRFSDSLLEETKYNKMRNLAYRIQKEKGMECIPYYCAMYDDCFYMFRIDKCRVRKGTVTCGKTTDFSDTRRVSKSMVYFDFKEGVRYEYRNK